MRDLRAIVPAARESRGWETGILAAILLYAGIWLGTVVAYYPPRGVDDLVYHLPPVYQAVQTHRFEILDLTLRTFFAFPFDGEMPFLWIALLTGGVRWVDGAQLAFAVLGIFAVHAIGRAFGLRHRGAFFAAGLFGAMPVVLHQATSNYIDVIVNVWILSAAVALLAYERSGSRAALFVGGLTAGLVLGSKYQAILFAAALAGIACLAALRRGLRGARLLGDLAIFAAPAGAGGLYWYVRNWILYSNPFYPLPVALFGTTVFPGDWPQGRSVWSVLLTDPSQALKIAAWDPGLRTFDGGLGFVFWGLGLAAWAWLFTRRVRGAGSDWRSAKTLTLGLVPVGVFSLFLAPFDTFAQTPRYVLVVGGLAFVALGAVIEQASSSGTGVASVLRGAGVLGAGMAVVLAAGSNAPLLDLSPAAAEPAPVRKLGEAHYLRYSMRPMAVMAEGWAPLDAMTANGAGLTVYQATDFERFWTGPTFGTDLQNRVWNFLPSRDQASDPDAYYFHSLSGAPLYLGKEIHRETVAADPRYELVATAPDDVMTVYVAKRTLAEKGRRGRLIDYYKTLRPKLVNDTAPIAEAIPEGQVLLATFPFASAFLVHEYEGRLRAELVPLAKADLESESARHADRAVYTIGAPIAGRRASAVREFAVSGRSFSLFLNEPVAPGGGEPLPSGAGVR
jgi:hypothetical protein